MSQSEQGVRLIDLEPQQLVEVRRSIEQEREQFTNAFTQLRSAQAKFLSGLDSLKILASKKVEGDHKILMPLTSSLYVPGKIVDRDRVLVDIGTGFFIEKSMADARVYYQSKVNDLKKEMEKIKVLVEQREQNLQMVAQVMQMKMQQQTQKVEA